MKQRILIVRTDRIGDLLLTIPMATVLKRHDPETHVAFLVQNYTAPLLTLSKDIDEVILFDKNWLLRKKIEVFRSAEADVVFIPSPKPDLATAASLARIPQRIGTAFRWYSPLFTDHLYDHRKTAERHEAEYNVRMLQKIGIFAQETPISRLMLPEGHEKRRDSIISNLFGSLSARFVALHVGSGGSSPMWSIQDFAEVAKWVCAKLHLPVLLTGSGGDHERMRETESLIAGTGCDVRLLSDASLLELASVLDRADLVIAGSTGPGHLAATLGVRTIGLFPLARALSKERWGFRGLHAINVAPKAPPVVSCPSCKECVCMEHISPNEVIAAAEALLAG